VIDNRPKLQAHLAGFLYFLTIVTGIFAAFYVRGTLMVSGEPAATAQNIVNNEGLYRLGLASDLVMAAAYVGVTVLLFHLLRPVGAVLSGLAAVFSIIGIAVIAANSINHAAALTFLSHNNLVTGLDENGLRLIAHNFLRLHGQGYNIASVFFGFYCGLVGLLIIRSQFLPRLVGCLMLIAGLCFVVDAFMIIVAPTAAIYLDTYTSIASIVGEGALTVWLSIFGVNEELWLKRAGRLPGTAPNL
jgi:hypothetical protein